MVAENMKCDICGNNNSFVYGSAKCPDGTTERIFRIRKCANCDFVFLAPGPEGGEIVDLYFDGYYGNTAGAGGDIAAAAFSLFRVFRKKRICKYRQSGRILDVGCGDGSFLNLMKRSGWEVFGVETSEIGNRLCEQKKINVRRDVDFQDDFFDVITLWHSLEHMKNPLGILQKLHRVLSKTGILLVSVPNIESMEYSLFKRFWFHLDLPRHLCHFSPRTLKKLLANAGFRTLKVGHCSAEYNPYGLLQTIMNVFTPEFNFLYNRVKRNKAKGQYFFLNWGVTLLLIGFYAIPAFWFSYFFSIFKKGGVIHLYAEKIS